MTTCKFLWGRFPRPNLLIIGPYLGRYWRDATDDCFCYLMDPDGLTDASLRVTYFGNDAAVGNMGRDFDINETFFLINTTNNSDIGLFETLIVSSFA